MLKRVFFAIKLDSETLKNISLYQKNIAKKFNEKEVKWVDKINLHITLHFIGSVKEDKIDKLIDGANKIEQEAFTINFSKITYFPKDKKDAKLIWIEGDGREVSILHDKLIKNVSSANQDNSFKLHITLGRVKKWELKKRPFFDIPDINKDVDINMKVDRFYLIESILKKTGPEHKTLKKFLLKNE